MEAEPTSPQGETLLMIDDEPLMTDVFSKSMSKRGFQVLIATSGKEALALVDSGSAKPDLIVTDMTMPDMDGLAVARELNARLPHVPVLIVTGHDLDPEQMELPPNVVEIIRKPYQLRPLAEHLRKILAQRK